MRSLRQVGMGVQMVQREGVMSLWSGLAPALARSFFYGGATATWVQRAHL